MESGRPARMLHSFCIGVYLDALGAPASSPAHFHDYKDLHAKKRISFCSPFINPKVSEILTVSRRDAGAPRPETAKTKTGFTNSPGKNYAALGGTPALYVKSRLFSLAWIKHPFHIS
jgi:hypothetical protein